MVDKATVFGILRRKLIRRQIRDNDRYRLPQALSQTKSFSCAKVAVSKYVIWRRKRLKTNVFFGLWNLGY